MDKWTDEDFADAITPQVVEDDPWADPMESYQLSTSSDKEDQLIHLTLGKPSLGDLANINSDEPDDVVLSDEEDWSDIEFADLGWEDKNGSEEVEWDEPEPAVEYDPDLREVLHVVDYDTTDLARRLKINELLSSILYATELQKERIVDLLDKISASKLRSWFPLLREQQWTGDSIILFLEFRTIWESKPEWWENSYWDRQLKCWNPSFDRSSLTLNDTYALIQRRLHCQAYEVIEESWFEEYDYFTLWTRGFRSFASFALYRASLRLDEDWKSDIGVYEDEFYEEGYIPYRQSTDYYPNGKSVVVWDGRRSISG